MHTCISLICMYMKVGVAEDEALAGGAGLATGLERYEVDQDRGQSADVGCLQAVGGAGEAAALSRLAGRLSAE